jgi:Zn-finger nucleic acid-binding protein
VRNDVDLHGKHKYSIKIRKPGRICAHCDKPLQTVKLDLDNPFYIERCKTCFGLFFDPGEIETLLESSVSHVFDINLKLIKSINKDRYKRNQQIKYVKCPVCRILMNRVNFGRRSGVIVDQCKKHGIWVDSGEITHLMEWKKAGGELLQAQQTEKTRPKKQTYRPGSAYNHSIFEQHPKSLETDLLDTVSSVIYKLFK